MPHSRRAILHATARVCDVDVDSILDGWTRDPVIVRARGLAAKMMRDNGHHWIDIGSTLNRSHAAAVRSCERAEDELAEDPNGALALLLRQMLTILDNNGGALTRPEHKRLLPPAPKPAPKLEPAPSASITVDTALDRDRIRKLRRQGWTMAGLAKFFGCTVAEIEAITGERLNAYA